VTKEKEVSHKVTLIISTSTCTSSIKSFCSYSTLFLTPVSNCLSLVILQVWALSLGKWEAILQTLCCALRFLSSTSSHVHWHCSKVTNKVKYRFKHLKMFHNSTF